MQGTIIHYAFARGTCRNLTIHIRRSLEVNYNLEILISFYLPVDATRNKLILDCKQHLFTANGNFHDNSHYCQPYQRAEDEKES